MIAVGIHRLPLPGGGAHLLDAVLGGPAQYVSGLGRVGVAGGDIARTAGVHRVGQRLAAGFFIGVENIHHAVALAGTQVADEKTTVGLQLFQRRQMALGQVHHMDVIPHAGAVRGVVVVAENMQLLQLAHRDLGDVGDQIVGDTVRVLADETAVVGADRIKIAQQGHVQARIGLAVVDEDALNKELGGTVGIGGAAGGEVLPDRYGGGIAVDGSGGGEDEVLHIVAAHSLQEHEGTAQVIAVILQGLRHALTHRLQTGKVNHCVDVRMLGKKGLHLMGIAQLGLDEGDGLAGDLLHSTEGLLAGIAEVVRHHNVISRLEEFHTGVTADVPGAAAD